MSAVTTEASEELFCYLVNEEAIRQYWEVGLVKAGLSLRSDIPGKGVNEGKFAFVRPRRLPPWKVSVMAVIFPSTMAPSRSWTRHLAHSFGSIIAVSFLWSC